MDLNKIAEVKAPIIYIGATFVFSTILYTAIDYGIFISYVLASMFLVFIYLKEGKEFLFIIMIFLCVGFLFNINYYKFDLKNGENIKIDKLYTYGGIGEIRGRKVFLEGDLKGLNQLDRVKVFGEFSSEINKDNGMVGKIKIKNIQKSNSIWNKLNDLKNEYILKVKWEIGERDSGIVSSILFGDKNNLEEDDMNAMKKYGIIHVMSVSGLHIGLIYLMFKKALGEGVGIIVSFIYVVITGMAFSSMRAFIMVLTIYISFKVQKNNNSKGSLALASIIIFMLKPYSVLSIGFLLSFGATLGIIMFYKRLRKTLYKIGGSIGDGICISLSAQVFVIPVLIFYFNEFSSSFLIGNLILVPLINLILIISFAGFLTFKITGILKIVTFVIGTIIYILDFLINLLDKVALEVVWLNEGMALFYVSLIITFYFYKRGVNKMLILPLATIVVIGINLYSPFPKIQNTKDGLVLNYRGDTIALMKKDGNSKKVRGVFKARDVYRDYYETYIKDDCILKKNGEKLILDLGNKEYLLVLNGEKSNSSYDIIDFKGDKIKNILIIDDKIITLK